jgi:hypothetical protein
MIVQRQKAQGPIATASSKLLLLPEVVEDDTKNPTSLVALHRWRLLASITLLTFLLASRGRLFLSTSSPSQLVPLEQGFMTSAFFAEGPSSVVTEKMKIDFLSKYNANGISHSSFQLMDHLKGTRDLLLAWDQPHHVQDAGLFHSV